MTLGRKFANVIALIALVIAGLMSASCGGSRAQQNGQAVNAADASEGETVEVSTAPAIIRSLPRFIETTGSLAADEATDVAPTVGGRVIAVGADVGSYVGRGHVLARLDSSDARLRVEQARAGLAQSLAAVRQAEARIGLRPGSQFDPARVAEVQAAKAAYDLAEKNLRRYEQLLESGDVSRASYDQQKAQRDQLREQYMAALAQARQGYAAVQTARAAAEAARVQVEQAEKGVRDSVVVSPISGYVSEMPADVGEYVSTQSKVATIVRTNPLRALIDIPEQSIGSVRVGQSVSVTTSAYPDRSFSGRVARISPNVSAQSRTLTVEAEVANPENLLKPGQFATVRILLPESDPAVLVPARAVSTEGTTSRVFVVHDGYAEERLVATGRREGDLVEVKGNIRADELVATSNVDRLSDGAKISNQ